MKPLAWRLFDCYLQKKVSHTSLFLMLNSEPSAGSVNVRGHNTNSTSIILEWNDVPVYERNGIITSYNITYQSLTDSVVQSS